MKLISLLAGVVVLLLQCQEAVPAPAEDQGIAIAIIYDTSGSMKDAVRDKERKTSPKYVIANRALVGIARQIDAFVKSDRNAARPVQVGLFTFRGGKGREVIKFGPFSARAFEEFAARFNSPEGNTPLGNTISAAWERVLASGLSRKHVLVITDGVNTAGPEPGTVLPALQQQAQQKQTTVAIHFVAFDVNAKVFDPVKRLGATVLGAADEVQLNTGLQYILQQKILLEDEEPKKQ